MSFTARPVRRRTTKRRPRASLAVVATLIAVLSVAAVSASSDRQMSRTAVEVIRVIDGDTLWVRNLADGSLNRVRLLGIDAPEAAYARQPGDCYATVASKVLTGWLPAGTLVLLVGDDTQAGRDRFGRLLRYVDHQGRDIAQQLLLVGAARPSPGLNRLSRAGAYTRVAAEAQHRLQGMWGAC